jgi:hypothetical protein
MEEPVVRESGRERKEYSMEEKMIISSQILDKWVINWEEANKKFKI